FPETGQMSAERPQGLAVAGDAEVLDMAAQHAGEPAPGRADALMHACSQFLLEASEFGAHPVGHGPSQHDEPSPAGLTAGVGEAQEVEGGHFATGPGRRCAGGRGVAAATALLGATVPPLLILIPRSREAAEGDDAG